MYLIKFPKVICGHDALRLQLPFFIHTSFLTVSLVIPRVCICGYPRQQIRRYKGISTRLTVTSGFLVQLITGIHYAL